jgi:putative membrane protein insertion efficiency factor
MRHVLALALRAYRRVVSPLYGDVCRYYPSCSAYALEAVETHGAAKGSVLAMRRVGRCHPWAAGGLDPVPEVFRWRRKPSEPSEPAAPGGAALRGEVTAP